MSKEPANNLKGRDRDKGNDRPSWYVRMALWPVAKAAAVWRGVWNWLKSGAWHNDKSIGLYGVLIAAAGLWYVARQTSAMIAQSRLEQRPWIKVHAPKCERAVAGEAEILCTLPIVNLGPTPGRITSIVSDIVDLPQGIVRKEVLRTVLEKTGPRDLGDHIPPDMTFHWPVGFVVQGGITPQVIADIESGKRVFCVVGRINYFDINDLPHKTEFCFISKGQGPIQGRELQAVFGFNYLD